MIAVDRISKRYDGRLVVEELSFNVQAGRVTGFVGPNGAGKSSTMRMMVGLSAPDSGSVSYDGIPFAHLAHPATVVGAMLDPQCMHPGRSARQHLRSIRGYWRTVAVAHLQSCSIRHHCMKPRTADRGKASEIFPRAEWSSEGVKTPRSRLSRGS